MIGDGIYPYKSYVDRKSIDIFKVNVGENNYRYSLSVNFNNANLKKRPLAVIMKNPSRADENNSDRTVNNILEFAHQNKYTKVHILNLYGLYSTDAQKVKELVNAGQEIVAIGEENDKTIKDIIKNVEDIIIAWGTPPEGMKVIYKKRVKKVMSFLEGKKLYYVFEDYQNRLYPRHPQVWASNAADLKLEPWNGGTK